MSDKMQEILLSRYLQSITNSDELAEQFEQIIKNELVAIRDACDSIKKVISRFLEDGHDMNYIARELVEDEVDVFRGKK